MLKKPAPETAIEMATLDPVTSKNYPFCEITTTRLALWL